MSERDPLDEIFSSITNGLTGPEVGGFYIGFQSGLERREAELARLQQLNPGVVTGLLNTLDIAMKSESVIKALSDARTVGNSPDWLRQQIETGLIEAIDLRIKELSQAN